jgi:hypothetical protein
MAYTVEYRNDGERPWKIINTKTGRVVGCSRTREIAAGSLGDRYAVTKAEGGIDAKTQTPGDQ